jgi:hypothetical protein
MAIVQSVNEYDFRDAFSKMGRKDQFSYEGLGHLFRYFDDYSEEIGEPFKLDVIAICCDFVECSSIEEFTSQYLDDDEIDAIQGLSPSGEFIDGIEEWLSERTTVITCEPDCILFQQF